jgi:hypothetical protein
MMGDKQPVDIVERLRKLHEDSTPFTLNGEAVISQAADEIERLRDLLRRIDEVSVWEIGITRVDRGIQEEIEAALGIQDNAPLPAPDTKKG